MNTKQHFTRFKKTELKGKTVKVSFGGKTQEFGLPSSLLSYGKNTKTAKNVALGIPVRVYSLTLTPHSENDAGVNLCTHSTKHCRDLCLFTSGYAMAYKNVNMWRRRKTNYFLTHTDLFMRHLLWEIGKAIVACEKAGLTPAFRLNVNADVDWASYKVDGKNVYEWYTEIQFYDYTAVPKRVLDNPHSNNYITFSYKGTKLNERVSKNLLGSGRNVAVVFNTKPEGFPDTHWGFEVINGDKHDLRYMDKQGVVVGLSPKGYARTTEPNPFIVEVN